MSKYSSLQASSQFPKERGTSVPASIRKLKLLDGTMANGLGVDLSQAIVPDRSYHAELAGLAYENGIVKLLFGQATRNNKVRSLIEISMSPLAAIQALTVTDSIKNPSLVELIQTTGEDARTLSEFSEDPPEVARLNANMISMAFSGSEASIDFYDASPFTMRGLQIGSTNAINVVGVVRVDTQTALVHELLLRLRELSVQFPPQIKGLEGAKI